jgi:hypothetical protein
MKPWREVPRCWTCAGLAGICAVACLAFWAFVFIVGASIVRGSM